MDIIGSGFVATALGRLAGRHPDATVLAAGVSRTTSVARAEYDREAHLLYDTIAQSPGRTVVFLSTASAAMYGTDGSPGTEDGPVFPPSAYGRHKLALETSLRSSGARWLVLRVGHLVGQGQPAHQLLPALVAQVGSGSVIVHRRAHRDLVDVEHLVLALDCLLAEGVHGEVVNVATGNPAAIEDIVTGIEARLARTADHTIVDSPEVPTAVSTRRLHALVPETTGFGFGPGYLSDLLDRYIGPVRGLPPGRARAAIEASA